MKRLRGDITIKYFNYFEIMKYPFDQSMQLLYYSLKGKKDHDCNFDNNAKGGDYCSYACMLWSLLSKEKLGLNVNWLHSMMYARYLQGLLMVKRVYWWFTKYASDLVGLDS